MGKKKKKNCFKFHSGKSKILVSLDTSYVPIHEITMPDTLLQMFWIFGREEKYA